MSESSSTLKDVCEFIIDCLHATAPIEDTGFPLIRTPNIGRGRLDLSGVQRVSEDTYLKWTRRATPIAGDLILAREAPAGNVAVVDEAETVCLGQRTVHLRPDKEQVDAVYLCYFLLAPRQQSLLLAGETGATSRHVNMKDIRRLPISGLPRLDVQKKIGGVVGAYDDLIENNRRRIGLLEEAARLLYREWFVHFRFPGHEHVKISNGLPEGWGSRTLGELAVDVSYGFTESASHDVEGPKFLRITDIVNGPVNWSNVPRCPISDDKLQRFLLSPGDIVVARTGATTGWARRIGRMSEPAVFASYLVRFCFGEAYRPELAATFMESDAYKAFVRANLGGAAQPNASAVVLGSAPVPVPTPSLQKDFTEVTTPFHELIDGLMEQNQKLSNARDLLLPRLMSGEIAV